MESVCGHIIGIVSRTRKAILCLSPQCLDITCVLKIARACRASPLLLRVAVGSNFQVVNGHL